MTDAPPLRCLSDEETRRQNDRPAPSGKILKKADWDALGDQQARDFQLSCWVDGVPLHNLKADECCPDFSCCRPELLAEKQVRDAFFRGDSSTRTQMLGMFLGAAFATADERVYIAGVDDPGTSQDN